jgi:hypothetical protein
MIMEARSPQADILDELIWDRLPAFWKDSLRPDDRDVLNAIYESCIKVLDSETVRLEEIQRAKSILTCPVFTQRRWAQLDLSLYDEVRDFIAFVYTGVPKLDASACQSQVDSDGSYIPCSTGGRNALHWHLAFPWTPSGNTPEGRTLDLGYPTSKALTKLWRSSVEGGASVLRLMRQDEFECVGNTIRLLAWDGSTLEVHAALDVSDRSTYDKKSFFTEVGQWRSTRTVGVRADAAVGFPVHAMVIRNYPGAGATNTADFVARREFYPFTGNPDTGAAWAAEGLVSLPVTVSNTDAVVVFGVRSSETEVFTSLHLHAEQPFEASGAAVDVPLGVVSTPAFLDVYVNGLKLNPTEYRYVIDENRLYFKTALLANSRVDLRYTLEQEAEPSQTEALHVHAECSTRFSVPNTEYATFDDGGEFDDTGEFDDLLPISYVYLAGNIDTSTLDVWVNGVLQAEGVDYTAGLETVGDTERIRLTFGSVLEGKTVAASYRQQSGIYVYGSDELRQFLSACRVNYGASPEALLRDPAATVQSFRAVYDSRAPSDTLIKALKVYAGGGNILLALFFDETAEYQGLPVAADNQPIAPANASLVESFDTDVVDIPVLQDHVQIPDVRLFSSSDYRVTGGTIYSNQKLDGIWWCPIVVLDEHYLAKNFGALLGDVRDSSVAYRDALLANLLLRFNGPTARQLSWSAAVMAGSPMITQDGTVQSIIRRITGYNVTVHGEIQDKTYVVEGASLPRVGEAVMAGFSLASPLNLTVPGTEVVFWSGLEMFFGVVLSNVRRGDRLRFKTTTGAWASYTIEAIETVDSLARLTLAGPPSAPQDRTAPVRIYRDIGAPFAEFAGTIASVTPIEVWELTTSAGERFAFDASEPTNFKPGQQVLRGQPVQPQLAQFYDHESRPDWHWLRAEARTSTSVRSVTVQPGPAGLGLAEFTPNFPYLTPGTQLKVGSQTFQIRGHDSTGATVLPNPSNEVSGEVQISVPVDPRLSYFEVPTASAVFADAAFLVGEAQILAPVSSWPAMGRVVVNGMEIRYYTRTDTTLEDIIWPETFETLFPAGTELRLVGKFEPQLINEAFAALLQARVVAGTPSADLYPVLAPSSAVLELVDGVDSEPLQNLLQDVVPPGTTVVSVSRHIVDDQIERA